MLRTSDKTPFKRNRAFSGDASVPPGQQQSSATSHSQLLQPTASNTLSPPLLQDALAGSKWRGHSHIPTHPLARNCDSTKHNKSSVLQRAHNSPPPFPLLFGSWPPVEAAERGINGFCQPTLFSSYQNQINASSIVFTFSFARFFYTSTHHRCGLYCDLSPGSRGCCSMGSIS